MKLNYTQFFLSKKDLLSLMQQTKMTFPFMIMLFMGFLSCTRTIATDKLPATQIVFGHGGGFTGMVHEYALLENGYIIRVEKDSAEQRIVKKIGKKKAAAHFAAVDSMRLHTWLYDVPGNIYHFIILKREGKKDNKIVWDGGGKDDNAPHNIEEYYKKLSAELPEKNKKNKKNKDTDK